MYEPAAKQVSYQKPEVFRSSDRGVLIFIYDSDQIVLHPQYIGRRKLVAYNPVFCRFFGYSARCPQTTKNGMCANCLNPDEIILQVKVRIRLEKSADLCYNDLVSFILEG